MSWPVWSVRLWVLAFVATLNLVTTGCGSSMPSVYGVADRDFAAHQRSVRTVDILPVDLQVWTGPGTPDPESLRLRIEGTATGQAEAQLARRGYQIGAQMDWDGAYAAGDGHRYQAMSPTEVVETNYALSSYGRAVASADQGLLEPFLPHRLGVHTGSDATLYIGGWAYVGDKKSSTGAKVAKGVLIGLLIVAVVVIVIAAAKEGGGGGLGKVAGGAGKAAASAGKAAAKVASGMARTVGRVGLEVSRGAFRVSGDILDAMAEADYRGRTHTHITVQGSGRPNYYQQRDTPRRGNSQMYVEMTLIDNHTGETLWHARQRFNAHGASSDDVNAVIARMLESLPAGG